jgi:uncharacterized protein (TIGR00369 family)
MGDDDDETHLHVTYASHWDMDEAFCARMRAAIAAPCPALRPRTLVMNDSADSFFYSSVRLMTASRRTTEAPPLACWHHRRWRGCSAFTSWPSGTGRPSSPWSRVLENLAGALHGGVAASLLDNALGAVQSLLPAGARSATLNLNVSYLRGLTIRSGTMTAQGRVVRLTRSAAFAEGAVTNSLGEICAQAVATFAVSYPREI